jgi:ribosome-associated protein
VQYIGKLMRGVEAEPIRAALVALTHDRREDTAALHQAEEWRTRLLERDEALDEFAAVHPDTDLRKLRSLTGVARTTGPEATLRRARRDLFRFIRAQLIAATDGPDEDTEDKEHTEDVEDAEDT